ncbi:D-hexose-6-phosphate mutarotase [Halopseudomonas maritima]|uniref:D-hexose-6-phosphate mutarotase n=1 Tax=Halopseudomonas maritima TaxID=2918528 RepID=UPI001EEBA046|nr:D-hexose-6-phosphate mutarotase [Halopseudomonas maritima]UJJ31516.1 D-hexose-6-phosphate mutarotase [Halopseudomonas maritima]
MLEYAALPDGIVLTHNSAGKAFLKIEHPAVRALVALEGAHLVSCIPTGQPDLLWMSQVDAQAPGGVLRGGVPLCWPWFGSAQSGPAHGIARRNLWQLEHADADQQGVRLRFSLPAATLRSTLPGECWALTLELSLGATLHMALTTRNTGQTAQSLSQALHSYLPVSDISRVRVEGLAGARYLDQLSGKMQSQHGALHIDQEVDRIYLDHREPLYLHDTDRILEVRRSGSASVVLWNPWQAKSTRLDNFPAEGYRQMLCIEAANADADARLLHPGEQHTLACEICQIAGK